MKKKLLIFVFSVMIVFNMVAVSGCGGNAVADTESPKITLNVDKNEIDLGQSVKLSFSVSDNVDKSSDITVDIEIKDEEGAIVTEDTYTANTRKFTPLSHGNFTIRLTATDKAGNSDFAEKTVLVNEVLEPYSPIKLSFLDTASTTVENLNTKLYIDVFVEDEEVVPGVTIYLIDKKTDQQVLNAIDFVSMTFKAEAGDYKLVMSSSYKEHSAQIEKDITVLSAGALNTVYGFSWEHVSGYDYSTMTISRDGISFKSITHDSPIFSYGLSDISGSFKLLYTVKNVNVWSNKRGAEDFPSITNVIKTGKNGERADKTVLMLNENNTFGARVYSQFYGEDSLTRHEPFDTVANESRVLLVRDDKDYTMNILGKLKASYSASNTLEKVQGFSFKVDGMTCEISDISIESIEATKAASLPENPNYGASVSVHDPSIFKDDDGMYYTFGTHFAVAMSENLFNWSAYSRGGANNASKLYGDTPWRTVLSNAVEAVDPQSDITTTWAPDIIKHHGKYYMYYSLTHAFGSSRSFIGRVESDNALGPYTNSKEIVKSTGASGMPNAIDPALFTDKDGKLWMSYGSFFGGIFIKELYNSGENYGLPKDSGIGKKIWAGGDGPEGPYIFYNKDNGYYYLMTSHASLSSNYNMRIARSVNPDGPYLDMNNVNVADNVNGGVKLAGNYQFEGYNTGYAALGHNSVLNENGKYLVVYHTRFKSGANGVSGNHNQQINQLFFNEDGWSMLAPNRYAGETLGKVSYASIKGDYDLLIHSQGNDAGFVTSSKYTLLENGTVMLGTEAKGSFVLKGNYYINITIDNIVYKGVVVPQWNNDKSVSGLSITALSNDGRALWANVN